MGELKATFNIGLEVLQCSKTIASYDQSPVTAGPSLAEYRLLHGLWGGTVPTLGGHYKEDVRY